MSTSKDSFNYSSEPDLSDHVKRKNRLISPWNKIPSSNKFQISSWHRTRLPEIIWIGELIQEMGPIESLRALEIFVQAAFEGRSKEEKTCPFLAAYWGSRATTRSKDLLIEQLATLDLLDSVKTSLGLLLSLYPEYPLRFVKAAPIPASNATMEAFSKRLAKLISRFSVESVRIHSHIMLAENRTGHLHFPENYTPPNFDYIYSADADCESSAFKDAAGHIRACVGTIFAFFGPEDLTTGRYFWNRGLELSSCIPANG